MTDKSTYWIQSIKSSNGLGSVDRINEVLFGLIMVLTFTCSISAATAGREEVSTILWSALGCNIAWGFVDAFMYIFSVLLLRGEQFSIIRGIQNATTESSIKKAVKDGMSPFLSQLVKDEHVFHLSDAIKNLPQPPLKVFVTWQDLRQGLAIFVLVFLSTFPVTVPFIFSKDVSLAMRISNGIALFLLFIVGMYLGKQTGRSKIFTGISFTIIGIVLVAATIALGG
jgi:hypothetical protein